jgi:aspartate-semialdehyde dehydrogenase
MDQKTNLFPLFSRLGRNSFRLKINGLTDQIPITVFKYLKPVVGFQNRNQPRLNRYLCRPNSVVMRVAVVGATGMVGEQMRKILVERKFPVSEWIPVASEKSAGQMVDCGGHQVAVVTLEQAVSMKPDLALFSAGGEVSLEWARRFAEVGCVVVDNSSAWRMDPSIALVVPEVNASVLSAKDRIIANPNCSTIQLVLVLNALHRQFPIRRVLVSTYQSITGTGMRAVAQMENERNNIDGPRVYPYPIDRNCIPQCDSFLENGYTKEEMKLTNETVKILGDETVRVSATAVRVPVMGGHSEAVNIEFSSAVPTVEQVRTLLASSPGIVVLDNPERQEYPMPLLAQNKDEVFVGRIRRDVSCPEAINLWIVADNLRKGAATNAIQIAEYLI